MPESCAMLTPSRVLLLATVCLVALLAAGGASQHNNYAAAFECVENGQYPLDQGAMCCGKLSPTGKACDGGQVFKSRKTGDCFKCNVVFVGDRGYWNSKKCPESGYMEARLRPLSRPSGGARGFYAASAPLPPLGARRQTWAWV